MALCREIMNTCLRQSEQPEKLENLLLDWDISGWMWAFSQWALPLSLHPVEVKTRARHFPWKRNRIVSAKRAIEWNGWFWNGWQDGWVRGETAYLKALRSCLQLPTWGRSPFQGFTVRQPDPPLAEDEFPRLCFLPENVEVRDFCHVALRHWSVQEGAPLANPVEQGWSCPPLIVDWVEKTKEVLTARCLQAHLATALSPADPLKTPTRPSCQRRL